MSTAVDPAATTEAVPTLPLPQRPPAEPWRRVVARLIDVAIVATSLWVLVLLHVLWFMGDLVARVQPAPWGRWFVPTAAFVVLSAAFEILFLVRSKGQTPGKDIMKVRVLPRRGGEHVSVGRALLRWAVPGLVALLHPIWLAVAALGATGAPCALADRRSLHDRLAGTIVVGYDRDREDPTARRPRNRRERRRLALEADAHGGDEQEEDRP